MNIDNKNTTKYVLEELDDTHLLVSGKVLGQLKAELEKVGNSHIDTKHDLLTLGTWDLQLTIHVQILAETRFVESSDDSSPE